MTDTVLETWERRPTEDEVTPDDAATTGGPGRVEVRRHALLAALLGGVASVLAIAYLDRAAASGSGLDWTVAGLLAVVGGVWLVALVDARAPLLVADDQGLRIRFGRSWTGVPWSALDRIEHLPRRGPLRDGRLVPVAREAEALLADLDARGRRRSRFVARWYGGPLAVPLGLATRVTGAPAGLRAAITDLAGPATPVVDVTPRVLAARVLAAQESAAQEASAPGELVETVPTVPAEEQEPEPAAEEAASGRRVDPRPAVAHGIGAIASILGRRPAAADRSFEDGPDLVLGATALDPGTAERPGALSLPEAQALRRGDGDPLGEPATWPAEPAPRRIRAHRLLPSGRRGAVEELSGPLVDATLDSGDDPQGAAAPAADDAPVPAVEPAIEPVVGPKLALARTRLQLSVDQLAERTRIRPHVIESIEVDDFAPCGGDFYARGHLRTLARILGVDAAPLLAAYDAHHAHEPIDARRVFEAELATGSIRGTRGGPNWSVLVAAVMTLVLAWSIARLVMDAPIELRQPAPVLNGSGGLNNGAPLGDPVPVVLTAERGAQVMVRDGTGEIAWTGDLAIGETQRVSVVYPIRVTASDGGAVEVTVAGESQGVVGQDDTPAEATYVAD